MILLKSILDRAWIRTIRLTTTKPLATPVFPGNGQLSSQQLYNRVIPSNICLPPYVSGSVYEAPMDPVIHSSQVIAAVAHAARIVRQIFSDLESLIPQISTTGDIDDFVFSKCTMHNVYPSPLGYRGFPMSVCTSVNEIACHGIPSKRHILSAGDLLSVDISIYTGQAHGDACRSYVIRHHSDRKGQHNSQSTAEILERIQLAEFLCFVANDCCEAGIKVCGPNVPFAAIAEAISERADRNQCRVVAGIRGHGVGSFLHGPPEILHSIEELPEQSSRDDSIMKSGHIFTIEPCIALPADDGDVGDTHLVAARPAILSDGWSVVTADAALTAQFEHTIVITSSGHQILT